MKEDPGEKNQSEQLRERSIETEKHYRMEVQRLQQLIKIQQSSSGSATASPFKVTIGLSLESDA